MPILWRYAVHCYTRVFLLSLSTFITVLIVTRFKEIARFTALTGKISQTALFTFYQIPSILPMAIPISALIAAFLFFQRVSRNHELTALRASGLSFRTILTPLLLTSLLFALFNFFVCADLTVILSDISKEALEVATENARLNQVEVELVQGDFLEPFRGRHIDYIVCNPPYISEAEYQVLDSSVRDFEPKLALLGGTEFYERLKKNLPPAVNCFLEIGSTQSEAIKQIFENEGQILNDWAGHPRFFFLEKLGSL